MYRTATPADEELFWQWRQIAERGAWYGGRRTSRAEHADWFSWRVDIETLLVWPGKGVARIASNGEVCVYAEGSSRSTLLAALAPYASKHGGRLKCVVDKADGDAANAALTAGYREHPARLFVLRP